MTNSRHLKMTSHFYKMPNVEIFILICVCGNLAEIFLIEDQKREEESNKANLTRVARIEKDWAKILRRSWVGF